MNYNGLKVQGRDYSTPLADALPSIIGRRSKSIEQITAAADRDGRTVGKLIARLHAQGLVHIRRWTKKQTGPFIALYKWGPGKDAERPSGMTPEERQKRYRQSPKGRKKAAALKRRWRRSENGQQYQRSYDKARYARKKFEAGGVAAIDPLLAAIMGRPSTKEQTCT